MRIPKDGYFANQVMWVGWVDVEKPRTYIIGHWNYAPGTTKNVYVVSSADRVELFLNGRSFGFGEQSSRFLFTFKNVGWQPGELKAVGYDLSRDRVTEDSKKTAGDPFAVRLTPHVSPNGFRADGADIALINVEVVDKDGNRCPTALNHINFNLSGEAEWRGGIAQGPDNFILKRSLPVENGVNRVLIRSTTKAGKIVLAATADGLKPAKIELISKPFSTMNGLSLYTPSDNLPVDLSRGPTPLGESFKRSRQPIEIERVTAGSNVEKAINSIDDNEATDWSSNGQAKDAWIDYEFSRAAKVDQVVLKLVGWRTQSYPLQISVDGKVVYSGNSSRSLGYVTFTFPATLGNSVRIELKGDATNSDAFGNIIEIPGTPDAQSAAGKGSGKNVLGIVEAEFYAPLR
jgi:beta-galactosidase